MKLDRVFDIISFQARQHGDKSYFRYHFQNKYLEFDAAAMLREISSFAGGLIENDVSAGDRILIIPRECHPVALFLDLAAQMIGALPVIVHHTFDELQLHQVIEETQPKYLFIASTKRAAKLQEDYARDGSQSTTAVFHIAHAHDSKIYTRFFRPNCDHQAIESTAQRVEEGQLANIIYTSGSSGRPKGVMLTHKNIMSNLRSLTPLIPIQPGSVVLSYLPFSHILERAAIFAYLLMGMKVHVIEEVHQLPEALREIKPNFVTAVPRIIERIAESFERFRLQRGWWRKKVLRMVVHLAQRPLESGRRPLRITAMHWLARHLFFRKLRMALGGRLESVVVGGAHLRPSLSQFLEVAGIAIREGYGMTETAPIISINRFKPGLYQLGTVGLPLPNVEVKIDHTGEILVRGPNVTIGYYQQPAMTKDLFNDEGWLKTGDIGHFNEKGFLVVTDRKKEIIKTSAGKYIAPALLESKFGSSPFILQMLVIGFQRPFVSAVIVPKFDLLKQWCDRNNIHWSSPTYMVHNVKIKRKVHDEIETINKTLPKFKRVMKHFLSAEEWTTENGLLSAAYKPKRREIEQRYKKEIREMYGF